MLALLLAIHPSNFFQSQCLKISLVFGTKIATPAQSITNPGVSKTIPPIKDQHRIQHLLCRKLSAAQILSHSHGGCDALHPRNQAYRGPVRITIANVPNEGVKARMSFGSIFSNASRAGSSQEFSQAPCLVSRRGGSFHH